MFLFGIGTVAFLLVYWTLVPSTVRRVVFATASASVLTWYAPLSVAVVAGLATATYALLRVDAAPPGWDRALVVVLVCLVALAFQKYSHFSSVHVLGLSYAVFRLIHVAVDSARGKLRLEGFGRFLQYALFPPAFLSGPIERYQEFEKNADPAGLTLDAAFWGTRRILFGLLKKVFLVGGLVSAAEGIFVRFPSITTLEAWWALFLYSLYIYLDFSAYCDIALGIARLFGYRLSENFRWPYLSANVTEFWRSWHITLSLWLRDYVYLPVSVRLAQVAWLRPRPLLVGSLTAVVTMFTCGLWHGNTLSFALWGLGHGILLSVHQLYKQWLLGALTVRQRKALAASVSYRSAATAVTFLGVSLLWVFFRFSPADAGLYLLRLFDLG